MNKKLLLFGCLLLAALTTRAQFTFITNNGTITITGFTNPALVSVTIPSTISNLAVTAISSNAFAHLDVTAITIPDSVTNIGSNAFYECGYLTNATIGGGAIGPDAFALCIGLANVTLGSNVTGIGNEAFYGCANLPSLVIPGSVKDIGSEAFYSCSRGRTASQTRRITC